MTNKLLMLLVVFMCLHSSCNIQGNNDGYDDDFEDRRGRLTRRDFSCRNSAQGDTSINDLRRIDRTNAGEYRISGKCDKSNSEIEVSIEGFGLDIRCVGHRWSVDLDITSVIQNKEEVSIGIREESDTACATVKNIFLCPEGYIPIPRMENYVNYDFCVMEYEAKSESNRRYDDDYDRRDTFDRERRGEDPRERERRMEFYQEKAISRSSNDPWLDLTRESAIEKCKNNGNGYDLILNAEWQTIARHIESVDENWSLGRATAQAGNFINRGNLSGESRGRGGSSSRWEDSKQTHKLPNGEVIWDFSGNVWEMVKDDARSLGIEKDSSALYAVQLTGKNKQLFGPKISFSSIINQGLGRVTDQDMGLGAVTLHSIEDGVIRGGASDRDAGIFAVDTSINFEYLSRAKEIGFRCVYYP